MIKSLTGRFFMIYALTTCIMFILLFWVFTQIISDYFISGRYESMLRESKEISEEYLNAHIKHEKNEINFVYQIEAISRHINSRILIFNDDYQVINDASIDESNLSGRVFPDLPMLQEAYTGTIVQMEGTLDGYYKDPQLMVATPVFHEDEIVGVIVVLSKSPTLETDIQYIYQLTSVAMLVILAITFISTYIYSKGISRTIVELSYTVKQIASGDFTSRVNMGSEDELGELAVNINHMARELEKLEDMRKDFIANISHDFRSPLTSIKGFIQAMMDGTIPIDNQTKYLTIVLDETDRLTKLTNDILLLTKMENKTIQINKTHFDLHQVIRKILLQFEQKILDKNIDFTLLIPQHELYVYADMNQIQRVIANLIDNAIKFCSVGDSILVETSVKKNKVEVKIADSGPGISEEDIKYIWDRFHKADRSRGKDKKGIGLGLSIVREIIRDHHEEINVYSQEGKGATFVFTLSLSEEDHLLPQN